MSEPRRIGEVLDPTLAQLGSSDQARAYAAWARAAGEQVAAAARPKAFSRGILTVECGSSVWASELTYLSDQLLRRMREVVPEHPVKRLRFIVGQASRGQEDDPPASKEERREKRPARRDLDAARAQAEGVDDDRLRAAIKAALGAAAGEPPEPPADRTP